MNAFSESASRHASPDSLIWIEPNLVLPSAAEDRYLVDVDFSLAIHNRTGKFFIGQELFAIPGAPLGNCYYWRIARRDPPTGLLGRIIGRLQHYHVLAHTLGGAMRMLPRRRSKRPLLHLDPFTVPTSVLERRDAVLIHDLGPLTHPELFDPDVCAVYRKIYEEIAQVGPHLVFVSQTSEAQYDAQFPEAVPAHSRRIIHPPMRSALYSIRPVRPEIELPERFLLTVGSVGRRKNQLGSIRGYARSGLFERGVGYLICGGPEPFYEDVEAEARQTPGVTFLPYVSDDVLMWLYQHACGFVLMSLLEGFGMPVSEAVCHGLVPLVSRNSSLTEVAGSGAFQANPEDPDEIGAQMCRLADMQADERLDRLDQLKRSIERFGLAHFRQAWRDALFEYTRSD